MIRNSRHTSKSRLRIVAVSLLLFAVNDASLANTTTESIMQEIYDAIAYLLPLSLRVPDGNSIWDEALVADKLEKLRNGADTLKSHAAHQELESKHIARSFDESIHYVERAFSNEWPEFAYFSMMDLVQHCSSCHSRSPAKSQDLFGQRLIARIDTREIPPEDVIRLFVATRQFDAALSKMRKILLDPKLHPVEADYSNHMLEYLKIALTVKRDARLAKDLLQHYAMRDDIPLYLQRRINVWIETIDKYAEALVGKPDFDTAKSIFYAADSLSRGPGNRLRATHDLIASSIIRMYLDQNPQAPAQILGEAYYILGVAALRTLEPKFAVPEMELLFAASITAAPQGPYAEESYALLEEYGYVHEDHLAGESPQQSLIDMQALRQLIGH